MFSNSLKYLIQALSFLSVNSSKSIKYGVLEIAEKTNVPAPYLGKLLNLLVKEGIISSIKGPKGGFYLTDENRQVKLAEVVFLIEDRGKYGGCLMGFDKCNHKNPCPLHDVYINLKYEFLSKIESITLSDLVNNSSKDFFA